MSDYFSDDDRDHSLVVELSKAVSVLKAENKDLKTQLKAAEKVPVPKSIVKQIVEMEAIIRKLNDDLEYFKKYVPNEIIINRMNKDKPTRRGGIPK